MFPRCGFPASTSEGRRDTPLIQPTHENGVDYGARGVWEGISLGRLLVDAEAAWPNRPAVIDGDVVLSFAELGARSRALARQLVDAGVRRGDVVAVQLPNWWEAFVAFGATLLVGGVCNPIVPIMRQRELRFIFGQSSPKAAIVPSSFRSTDFLELYRDVISSSADAPDVLVVRAGDSDISPWCAVDTAATAAGPDANETSSHARDVALLMYTSGTTADPKGVLHTHESLVYEIRSIVRLFGLDQDDCVFMVSPLTHISGYLFAFGLSLMTGARVVLQDVWDALGAAEFIDRHHCTFTLAATTFLHGLVQVYREGDRACPLEVFMCGGADVPADLVREARDVLGADVVRTYGLTEMPTLTSGRPGGGEANITTDGYLIGPVECRVETHGESAGELLVRGPELFCGYLDPVHNEAFTADGFFRTGDLAAVGDDGTVTILGRSKDVIVRGGEKISSREIEDLLFGHPDVADVAVVPMQDARLGERVCAVVVPADGRNASVPALSQFLADRGLARHKHPERVLVLDALPRTTSGKVQKFILRERVAAAVDRGEPQRMDR